MTCLAQGVYGDEAKQSVDASAASVDGSAVSPQQQTEVFVTDIEPPEPDKEVNNNTSERDIFKLGATALHTSDKFDTRTYSLSYRNNRREWFWPWEGASNNGPDWGLDVDSVNGEYGPTEFDAHHAQGLLGFYITPGVYIQGQAGKHTLHTEAGDRTLKSNGVSAMFGLNTNFSITLKTKRDFVYPDGMVPVGITNQMASRDYTAALRWRPHPRLRILGKNAYRKYDDENNSQQSELSFLYGVSPSWPWIWAGVGVQELSFDEPSLSYWSPEKYTAYGVRFDASFPLTERLSASTTVNLDRLNEDGFTGNGYYVQGGLQYRLFRQLYARLDVVESKSLQSASKWTSDSALFSLNGPLF